MDLKVTPKIMGEDILLSIAPEMSHFVSESKSSLVVKQSLYRLRSGSRTDRPRCWLMTLQESGDQTKKVPILGDIPIIRWLFDRDNKGGRQGTADLVTPVIK